MTDNIKAGQADRDAHTDLPVRLEKLLDQYHSTSGISDDLRDSALLLLAEVHRLVKENAAHIEKSQHAFRLVQALSKFETGVETQVLTYLGEPPAEFGGEPNVMRFHDATTLGPALERMRARHDRMEAALKPLAELSVPEDYIPDYFTDPDCYGPTTEAETTDFFIRRQDIRRAREALGTYPRPEGYPFTEKD